jgi:hypothetical protein
MSSSEMWRRVGLVKTDVSEGRIACIFMAGKSASRIFFARGFFCPEDGDMFLRNVGSYKTHTSPHPRRRHSSHSPLWKTSNPTGAG